MPYTISTTYTVNAVGIRKAFRGKTVLDGVDLAVPAGQIVALLGPNGAGKTTLIRILATLLRPDAGTATVAGHDLLADPAGVRRAISLTGQYAAVDDMLTGEENLRMMARLRHLPPREARDRAARLLSRVRPRRRRPSPGQDLLGRHAPPPRPGDQPDRPAGAALPRRADDRPRPAQQGPAVVRRQGHGRRRRDGAAHHPVPRGGGAARRQHRRCCTRAGSWPRGPPASSSPSVGAASLDEVFLALTTAADDTDDLATDPRTGDDPMTASRHLPRSPLTAPPTPSATPA